MDYHRRSDHLVTGEAGRVRHEMPQPMDQTIIILDVAASRADCAISFIVGERFSSRLTGPWLIGQRNESMIVAMLEIANDAVIEGRPKNAMEVIAELLEGRHRTREKGGTDRQGLYAPSAPALLRPIIVPVRQNWRVDVELCDGAESGPVDVWLHCMLTRDVA